MWYRTRKSLNTPWSEWIYHAGDTINSSFNEQYQVTAKNPLPPFEPGLFRETSMIYGTRGGNGQMMAWFNSPPESGLWERVS